MSKQDIAFLESEEFRDLMKEFLNESVCVLQDIRDYLQTEIEKLVKENNNRSFFEGVRRGQMNPSRNDLLIHDDWKRAKCKKNGCPKCQSLNYSETTMSTGLTLNGNTARCADCGHKWELGKGGNGE